MILHLVELVYQNSMLYGYDPLLVLAVINVESIFDPGARGRYLNGAQSGALGLMQLKFETAQEMARSLNIPLTNKKDLLRPDVNIALGIAYLTRCISMFKSFKLGLMAYNQGPAAIYQNLSEKKPLSIAYYNKVLKSYYTFRELSKTPF
jgi:soluble lytic murein transglycosylase-like protein